MYSYFRQKWDELYGEYVVKNTDAEVDELKVETSGNEETKPEIESSQVTGNESAASWDQLWQEHWANVCAEEYEKFLAKKVGGTEYTSKEAATDDESKKDDIEENLVQGFEETVKISDTTESHRNKAGVAHWLKRIPSRQGT